MVRIAEIDIKRVPFSSLAQQMNGLDRAAEHAHRMAAYVSEESLESPFAKKAGKIDPARSKGPGPLDALQSMNRLVGAVDRLQTFLGEDGVGGQRREALTAEIDRRTEEAKEAKKLLAGLKGKTGAGWQSSFRDQMKGYYPPEEGIVAPAFVRRRKPLSEPTLQALERIIETVPSTADNLNPHQTQDIRLTLSLMLGKLGKTPKPFAIADRGTALAALHTVTSHLLLQRGEEGSFASDREAELYQRLLSYAGGEGENPAEATRRLHVVVDRLFAPEQPSTLSVVRKTAPSSSYLHSESCYPPLAVVR